MSVICAFALADDDCQIAILSQNGNFLFHTALAYAPDYETFIRDLHKTASMAAANAGHNISRINVTLPGTANPATGRLECPSLACCDSKPLQRDLQAAFFCSVNIINHGQALACAAASQTEYKDSQSIFGLFLDTVVCGGILAGNRLLSGANHLAGNWAHICLPWPVEFELEGRVCPCGRTGCLAQFTSLQSLSYDYELLTRNKITAQQIISHAEGGDIVAESVLQAFEDRLARGLALIINILDPDVIVLGGRLSFQDRLYINISRKWPGYVSGGAPHTQLISLNRPEEDSLAPCIRGAGCL